MAIKLIAIDLDDTLLDNRQQLSPRTLAVLQQAMRNGVAVTIATGRMFQSALPFATELGIKLPLITYNGALIRQGDNGETIFHRPIETALAQELADLFRRRNWYLQKYVDDRLYVAELDENGADIIEIGVPFSDPVADGPVVEAASRQALSEGVTLKDLLEELWDSGKAPWKVWND